MIIEKHSSKQPRSRAGRCYICRNAPATQDDPWGGRLCKPCLTQTKAHIESKRMYGLIDFLQFEKK